MNPIPHIPYCTHIPLWGIAQPINAFSSIAFLIAAGLQYRALQRNGHISLSLWILFLATAGLSVGSFIYHSQRTVYTLALDVIPIYIFGLTFLGVVTAKLTGKDRAGVFAVLGVLGAHTLITVLLPDAFFRSIMRHVFSLIPFILVTYFEYRRWGDKARVLFAACTLYALAIIARSLEPQLCTVLPWGTHFIWHMLGAVVMYEAVLFVLHTKKAPSLVRRLFGK